LAIEAKGRSAFALQYQLDTSLSDAERYPLKLHDLIVFSTNPEKAPRTLQWGRHTDRLNIIRDIPNLGFSGDHFLRPLFADKDWVDYDQVIIFVDPAGRGKDETAWWVLGQLNGLIYGIHMGHEVADPAEAMWAIANDVKTYKAREVIVEPNYGQGMWVAAFQPILAKVYNGHCSVKESAWAKGQKEVRIIDTLEPVLSSHRLVINEEILRKDAKEDERVYSFAYQLTHITRERNCLSRDDRVDSLAGGVAYYMASMTADPRKARMDQIATEKEQLVEKFEESLNGSGRLWQGRRLVLDEFDEAVWTRPDQWDRVDDVEWA